MTTQGEPDTFHQSGEFERNRLFTHQRAVGFRSSSVKLGERRDVEYTRTERPNTYMKILKPYILVPWRLALERIATADHFLGSFKCLLVLGEREPVQESRKSNNKRAASVIFIFHFSHQKSHMYIPSSLSPSFAGRSLRSLRHCRGK